MKEQRSRSNPAGRDSQTGWQIVSHRVSSGRRPGVAACLDNPSAPGTVGARLRTSRRRPDPYRKHLRLLAKTVLLQPLAHSPPLFFPAGAQEADGEELEGLRHQNVNKRAQFVTPPN